jgi:hypothetical protein
MSKLNIQPPPSFAPLRQEHQYKPKLFLDKFPIKAESNSDVIYTKIEKPMKIKEPALQRETLEKDLKNINSNRNGFNSNPFRNMENINKYYKHEPNLSAPEPPFVPSEKLWLSPEEQWRLYLSKTRDM